MGKRLSNEEATKIMEAAGLKPIVPYDSSATPWLSLCNTCKREVSPTLNAIHQGKSSCKYCSGNKIDTKEALEIFARSGLEPLEEFKNGSTPWKSRCLKCGSTVSPSLKTVKRHGRGCKVCSQAEKINKLKFNESDAIRLMREVGLEPLETYTNSSTPWKSRCLKCKKIVTPRLSLVKSKKTGCAYCAGVRIDTEDALQIFNDNQLIPLEPYKGNKLPWKSIHKPCGKEVSPRLNALQKGQGPCKYCARKAVHPDDAKKLFLEKGLSPLEPYSGDSKKPWKSIHLQCGNEVSPTYNMIQREETIGCHFCSNQFVDSEQAFQFFVSKDLQPLVPYPGTAKPWKSVHTVCGQVIQPRYGHVKAGRIGCPVCAKVVPISQERAFLFFRSKGLEPQEPFKGPHHPWKSIHTECGKSVSPRWASVQQGQGVCKYCAGRVIDENEAIALFENLGLKTIEPFPGGTKPWRSIHLKCGREVSPRFSQLKRGLGPCRYCAGIFVDAGEARALFISRGLGPLVDYPGSSVGWKSIHKVCGNTVSPAYGYVKMGGVGCNFCAGLAPVSQKAAKELFLSRGFKPLEPYVNTKSPIRAIHNVCGKEVKITYGGLKSGRGCKYCSIGGINLSEPGFLYLMSHEEFGAFKVGIGGFASRSNRIEQHRKYGWSLFKSVNFDTAESAYDVEQEVLNWLRLDLGLPPYLSGEEMPQGGHTETVNAEEVDLLDIWKRILELKLELESSGIS